MISVVLILLHLISGVAGPLHLLLHAHAGGDPGGADTHVSCVEFACDDPVHLATVEADHTLDVGCELCNLCVRPPVSFLPSRSVDPSISPAVPPGTVFPQTEEFRSDLFASDASPRAPPALI